MLDMGRRLRAAEVAAIAALLVLSVAMIPTAGPSLLAAAAVGGLFFAAMLPRLARNRRPEYLSVAVVAVGELALCAGIVLSTGPRVLLLALLTGPMLIGASVWPLRAVVAGTTATVLLMVGLALAVDPSGVARTPGLAVLPAGTLVSMVVVATAAQGADVSSRATAVVDRLTGLLNRAALLPHASQLAYQSRLARQPVALLLGDVDRFKEVNDRHGHARGDRVLAELSARLREALGSAGTLYRFGGEELLALVPGADAEAAAALAQALRGALARAPVDGLRVTISFGVAAADGEEPFDFQTLLAAADRALYEAKAGGRDRVRLAAPGPAAAGSRRGEAAGAAAAGRMPRERSARLRTRPLDPAGTLPEREAASHAHGDDGDAPDVAPAITALSEPLARRLARQHAATGSWLVQDEAARTHMLDMLHRIRRVRILAYSVILVCLLSIAPSYGWLPIVPPFLGAIVLGVSIDRSRSLSRPELAIGAAICFSLLACGGGFLLSHSRPFSALPLIAVLVFCWSPVFPVRGVAIGTALAAALIAGSAFAIGAHAALSDPAVIGVPLAVLVAAAGIGSALGRSSIDHHGASIVDQLTGMLSRRALEARVATVAHEVGYSREPVALIVGDIDRFKQINDHSGHAAGDAVLREVAYRMRKCLRAFEACYRIGGEEFVVLLPGMRVPEAAEIAERLRNAVGADPVDGLRVTMSFGVAASEPGEPFEYGQLFARADASLYDAKHGGRNRVGLAPAREPSGPAPGEGALPAAA
jgi:diguanylate cyclase (GGDEF)-like protein